MSALDLQPLSKTPQRPEDRLVAARYAMHRVRRQNYRDAVARGEIGPIEAEEKYRLAMANFDSIVQHGGDVDAMIADMESGYDG